MIRLSDGAPLFGALGKPLATKPGMSPVAKDHEWNRSRPISLATENGWDHSRTISLETALAVGGALGRCGAALASRSARCRSSAAVLSRVALMASCAGTAGSKVARSYHGDEFA